MEYRCSFPYSQQSATYPHCDPDQSSPQPPIPFNSTHISIKNIDTAESQRKYLMKNEYSKLKRILVLLPFTYDRSRQRYTVIRL
jgi:hypothetical protein